MVISEFPDFFEWTDYQDLIDAIVELLYSSPSILKKFPKVDGKNNKKLIEIVDGKIKNLCDEAINNGRLDDLYNYVIINKTKNISKMIINKPKNISKNEDDNDDIQQEITNFFTDL